MDGSVVDSEPILGEAVSRLFALKGVEVGPGEDKLLKGVAAKHGITLNFPRDLDQLYALYLELIPGRLKALPGVFAFLAESRRRHLKVVYDLLAEHSEGDQCLAARTFAPREGSTDGRSTKGEQTMTPGSILEVLAGLAFFKGLSHRNLLLLTTAVKPMTFQAGDYLGREEEEATAFYVLLSGTVSIGFSTPERGEIPVQTVGSGAVVSWSWLVPPYRWRYDCRATERVQALAFDAKWLRDQCEQYHDLGYHLLKHLVAVIGGRLTATQQQLLDLQL